MVLNPGRIIATVIAVILAIIVIAIIVLIAILKTDLGKLLIFVISLI